MICGMLQVTLSVDDVVKSVDFYHTILGLDFQGYWDRASQSVVEEWEQRDPPDYAEIRAGEIRIGLQPSRGRNAAGAIGCALFVDDLDSLHAAVLERGGEATEPVDPAWGSKTFTIKDPDGHTWTFLEPIEQ